MAKVGARKKADAKKKPAARKTAAKPNDVVAIPDWGKRLVGVHCSTAGGLHTAIERGEALGCTAIQIFSKNNNRWLAPPLTEADSATFLAAQKASNVRLVFAHAGYLINLASPDRSIVEQSMESMRFELNRAETLQLPFIVLHPGAHKGEGENVGIRRIADRLNILLDESYFCPTKILFEGTAGQGSSIGYRFEHLRDIIGRIRHQDRVGVCLDTAHLFAAGFDFRTPATYEAMWQSFDEIVGRRWLCVLHLNDSLRTLGSKVDRHTHIGKGEIGTRAFGLLMRDESLAHVAMVCETPKGKTDKEDRENLKKLHQLMG